MRGKGSYCSTVSLPWLLSGYANTVCLRSSVPSCTRMYYYAFVTQSGLVAQRQSSGRHPHIFGFDMGLWMGWPSGYLQAGSTPSTLGEVCWLKLQIHDSDVSTNVLPNATRLQHQLCLPGQHSAPDVG